MPDPQDSVTAALTDFDHAPDPWSNALLEAFAADGIRHDGSGDDVEFSDQLAGLRAELLASRSNLARFENLFRIAPIPLVEQDYTLVEEWMAGLRAQGVVDILKYLGDDVEAIRAVVPLIRIVSANPAATSAVGLPVEQLIGPVDPVIVNDGAQASWLAQLDAVWNRRPVAHASFTARTVDGRVYDAESTLAAPVIDGEPDFSRALFTLIDVTPHRDGERRMEDLVAAKSQFVAWVSHEIRTPLTAIVGFADLLELDPGMTADERSQMVAAIAHQAQEVTDLVDDLLVASRVELGRIDVANLPVDLVEQVHQTLDAGGSYAEGVTLELPAGELKALGDPARIRQILRNLLTNAERYGGPDVRITACPSESGVCVEVSDDGVGLPDSDWERVFEPYHRSSAPVAVRPESVGIGLSISRELAQLMGGSLTYERVDGRSVFRLELEAA